MLLRSFQKVSTTVFRRRPPRNSQIPNFTTTSDIEILYDPENRCANGYRRDVAVVEYRGPPHMRLSSKADPPPLIISIVAVHGLGSRSKAAWVHKTTGHNWLRDFLPNDLGNQARIMTFNHNSRWRSHSLRKTLDGYGKDLLVALERVRSAENITNRPLIFIGHSFGGLLIKQALVLAGELHSDRRHAGISSSTAGIVFLGTPHSGSKLAGLGKIVASFTRVIGSRTDLLQLVNEDSREAASLHDRFLKGYQKQAQIVCFYECMDSYAGGISMGPVVSESSASIPGGHNLSLATDHKGMNKFRSTTDEGYLKVMHELQRLLASISFSQRNIVNHSLVIEQKVNADAINNINHHIMIPYARNDAFISRNIIEQFKEKLANISSGHQRIALWGLGGVGKTQVVLEHAYLAAASNKCSVFWVHASDRLSFVKAYRKIAKFARLPVSDGENLVPGARPHTHDAKENDEEAILLKVKEWLEDPATPPYLLVLDNADNLLDFYTSESNIAESTSVGLAKYIPQGSKGTIIITTRDYQVASRLADPKHALHMTTMSEEEAEKLFVQQYPEYNSSQDKEVLVQLLEKLAHLPLAVVHAASYMRENFITPAQYASLFGLAKQTLLARGSISDLRRGHPEVPEAVLTTYFITFRQVQEQSPLATNLLRFMAFLDRNQLPEELLVASGIENVENRLLFSEAVGKILSLSLASRFATNSYDIHRLVHLSIRASLSPEETQEWRIKALNTLHKLFPRDEKTLDYIELCAKYIKHALAVVQDSFTLESTELLLSISRYYWYLGRYDEAETHLLKSLELRSRFEDETTMHSLLSRSLLTKILIGQGKYSEAESLIRKNLPSLVCLFGKEHPQYLYSLSDLGSILSKQGRYSEAEAVNSRAVKLQTKFLGAAHPLRIMTSNNMLFFLARKGKLVEMEVTTRQGLKESQETVGNEHPITQAIAHDLGWLLLMQRKYEEAESLGRNLLQMRLQQLGDENPTTLNSITFLAWVLLKQQRYAKAEELSRRVVAGREKLLGYEHPETLASVNNLAWVLLKQKKYSEAEESNRRALLGRQRVLGEEHPSTLASMYNLAWTLADRGKLDEAEVLSKKALNLRKKTLGDVHPYTVRSVMQYSKILKTKRGRRPRTKITQSIHKNLTREDGRPK